MNATAEDWLDFFQLGGRSTGGLGELQDCTLLILLAGPRKGRRPRKRRPLFLVSGTNRCGTLWDDANDQNPFECAPFL
jgi:hypothetical protein